MLQRKNDLIQQEAVNQMPEQVTTKVSRVLPQKGFEEKERI